MFASKLNRVIIILLMSAVSFIGSDGATGQSVEVTWNKLQNTGSKPDARLCAKAVYDPQDHRMLFFGGWAEKPYVAKNDTWSFDLTNDKWKKETTWGGLPAKRAGHLTVLDSSLHRLIVFGGSNWYSTWYSDTWVLDLDNYQWYQPATTGTPAKRLFHCGVYDPKTNCLFSFGGRVASSVYTNEVWRLDLSTWEWSLVPTSGKSPAPRECASAMLDELEHEMIIFGGEGWGDVWALSLDSFEWDKRGYLGNNRWQHSTVFNASKRHMVNVAGWGGPGFTQVFNVDSKNWLNVNVMGDSPSNAPEPPTVFDPLKHRIVMSIGSGANGTEETWEMTYTGEYPLTLGADTATLSASTGGEVNFILKGGVNNAYRDYLILGSLSGTSPGIPLPGGTSVIPLNWDYLTDYVIVQLNSIGFWNFRNSLDPSGNRMAQFNTCGPLPAQVVDLKMYFAYALCAPWDTVSNPVSILIEQ